MKSTRVRAFAQTSALIVSLVLAACAQPPIATPQIAAPPEPDYIEQGTQKRIAKDYAGAIADFDRAILLNPGRAEAYDAQASRHIHDIITCNAQDSSPPRLQPLKYSGVQTNGA